MRASEVKVEGKIRMPALQDLEACPRHRKLQGVSVRGGG